jgi:hypothetical protein
VRDALAAGGVTCEVEGARVEHPYMASALARPMRIFVADEHLAEARRLLAGLEGDAANDDELAAQALSAGRLVDDESVKEVPPDEPPSLGLALAFGLLLPAPVVCFHARANKLGMVFLGVFVLGLFFGPLSIFGLGDDHEENSTVGLIAPVAKVADVAVGIPLVLLRRRRARKS